MKIENFWINKKNECKIKFVAETQEESSQLVQLGTFIKKPNIYYGRVDEKETWAWLFIPLNKENYAKNFGNSD